MESISNAFSGNNAQNTTGQEQTSSGGFGDKINTALGGGEASEKNEDLLDKG